MCIRALSCPQTMSWLNDFFKAVGNFSSGIPVSWVDFVTLLVLSVGIVRGRKRGLSEEILDLMKWLVILVGCAFFYHQLGEAMSQSPIPGVAPLQFYVTAYLAIALFIWSLFGFIKKRFGQKLIESDVFGRLEFYGGMMAGAVRWTCMYFFVLSVLHAPFYSEADREQRRKEVEYNYGSDFFPSVCKIQDSVFLASLTGKGAVKYLDRFLMEQVTGDADPLRGENSMARRNERQIDAIMGR